ncbi:MAG: medium chain dehydrogenase/reductase family protein [Chloroflexota bacterium]
MSYRRVIIAKFGGPDVLQVVEEAALPEPQPGEVRIKVLATSAAFTDTMIRKGIYPGTRGKKPPFSPGYDLVGVVDKLGGGVTKLKIGQKVAELTVIGAYAEYICLPEDRLIPVPDALDPAEAVSMILSYITAYQMLHRLAKVQKGQRILVNGASGAVGTALLQLGQLLDLEMYGTASTVKQDLIASLGATPIDYKTEDFADRIRGVSDEGLDAVFDCSTPQNFNKAFTLLKPGGTLVWYGMQGLDPLWEKIKVPFGLLQLYVRNYVSRARSLKFYSIAPLRKGQPDWFYEDLTALFSLLAQDKIKPVIDKRMPLVEATQAHKLIEQGAVKGKLVLVMGDHEQA